MDRAGDLASGCPRTTPELQRTDITVTFAGWTELSVKSVVVGELGSAEGAILAVGFVENRDVGFDTTFVHETGEILGRAVSAVRSEAAQARGRDDPACVQS